MAHPQPIGVALALECVIVGGVSGRGHHGGSSHTAAHKEERRGGTVLIASGDRDTFQLASNRTTILYPVRGQGMVRIGPAEVRTRYGIDPAQVPDFIALRGDPSDKISRSAGCRRSQCGDPARPLRFP